MLAHPKTSIIKGRKNTICFKGGRRAKWCLVGRGQVSQGGGPAWKSIAGMTLIDRTEHTIICSYCSSAGVVNSTCGSVKRGHDGGGTKDW